MPKLYVKRYCVRCGISLRVCIPTFVCAQCPVTYDPQKNFYYDNYWGHKVEWEKKKPLK